MINQIPHWQLLIGWTIVVAIFAWSMGRSWGRQDWKKIYLNKFYNAEEEL